MVRRGSVRTLGGVLAALLFVALGASTVTAATADCTVEVTPRAGAAGSIFTFRGRGFEPTSLVLHKNGKDAGRHDVDVHGDDPWQVSVRSRPGDEGKWSAELVGAECSATAEFRVTLANTDLASDSSAGDAPSIPVAPWLLVVGAGIGGGLVLGRRLRAGLIDNRVW